VELALGGLPSLPFRAGALLEDLLHISGRALRLPEVHDSLDLRVAHKRALDAGRFAGVDGLIEHVPAAQQLFCAARVQDDATVDLRTDRERDARRDVRLDETGDDV